MCFLLQLTSKIGAAFSIGLKDSGLAAGLYGTVGFLPFRY